MNYDTFFIARKLKVLEDWNQIYNLYSMTIHSTCEHLTECLLAWIWKCWENYNMTFVWEMDEEDLQLFKESQKVKIIN